MEIDLIKNDDTGTGKNLAGLGVSRKQISKADIARLADIAKREQVMVEMEFDGRIVRVSPMPMGDYGGTSYTRRGGVVL
ncbi:hypothetical protein [Rhizobium sp. BK379]|uniref:hypothetical protein n=1 Tax=Rhizobium sp. BK379 TaxID=2587059 RepID=UPI001611D420|nr:hypothetical protein [Rhizobium sp. BK379]MBB3441845.1 hypothetical protein [Rhizobium sp. BK379]